MEKYAPTYLITFPSAFIDLADKDSNKDGIDTNNCVDDNCVDDPDPLDSSYHFKRDMSVDPQFHFTQQTIEEIWGNKSPLIVEVGSGQGENIANSAREHPEVNYLALEVFDQGVAHTLLRCGNYDISNLRVAQVDAVQLFSCIDENLLEEVWTYFPDPWPKMRHHKRRIIRKSFIQDVFRVLRNDHLWRIATDISDYALHIHEEMSHFPQFINEGTQEVVLPTVHVGKNVDEYKELPTDVFMQSPRFEGRVVTSFEKKGIAAGHTIYDFTYRKVEA